MDKNEFQKMKRYMQQLSNSDVAADEIWVLLTCRGCPSDITYEQCLSQMGKCDDCLKKHIGEVV